RQGRRTGRIERVVEIDDQVDPAGPAIGQVAEVTIDQPGRTQGEQGGRHGQGDPRAGGAPGPTTEAVAQGEADGCARSAHRRPRRSASSPVVTSMISVGSSSGSSISGSTPRS